MTFVSWWIYRWLIRSKYRTELSSIKFRSVFHPCKSEGHDVVQQLTEPHHCYASANRKSHLHQSIGEEPSQQGSSDVEWLQNNNTSHIWVWEQNNVSTWREVPHVEQWLGAAGVMVAVLTHGLVVKQGHPANTERQCSPSHMLTSSIFTSVTHFLYIPILISDAMTDPSTSPKNRPTWKRPSSLLRKPNQLCCFVTALQLLSVKLHHLINRTSPRSS